MSCLGLGAVAGSLLIASRAPSGVAMIVVSCGLIGVAYVWLALPLGPLPAFAGLFLLGLSCSFFNVTAASILQIRARDDVRGRVMAIYGIAILGNGLIGAPLAGMLADALGVHGTFTVVAAFCGGTAILTSWTVRRSEYRDD